MLEIRLAEDRYNTERGIMIGTVYSILKYIINHVIKYLSR